MDEFAAFNMHRQSGEDEQPQQDIAASENDDAPSQPAKRPRLTSASLLRDAAAAAGYH